MVCRHSLHIMAIHGHITPATMILGTGTGDRLGDRHGLGVLLGAGTGVLLGHGVPHGIGAGDPHGVGNHLGARHGVHPGAGEVDLIMPTIVRVDDCRTDPAQTGLQIPDPAAI